MVFAGFINYRTEIHRILHDFKFLWNSVVSVQTYLRMLFAEFIKYRTEIHRILP
jgi:hypothetical protein